MDIDVAVAISIEDSLIDCFRIFATQTYRLLVAPAGLCIR